MHRLRWYRRRIRRQLMRLRRDWCIRRNHPEADWSPILAVRPGFTMRAYRCARHDHQTP